MFIKHNAAKPIFAKKSHANILYISLAVIFSLMFVMLGVKAKEYHLYGLLKNIYNKDVYKIPMYYLESIFETPDILAINIKHKNMMLLDYQRNLALNEPGNFRRSTEFDYVSGSMKLNGTEIPIKIRLKGDRKIHFQDSNQWSFRIKTKGDNTVLGMKRFSLHKPQHKNHIYNWVYYKMLEKEGLISIRYIFVDITLNGKSLGIYALEEYPEKRLIENNNRREGLILQFTESFGIDSFTNPIVPYDEELWTDQDHIETLNYGVNLLESFRRGEKKVSDVFDVDQIARFLAITDVMSSQHGSLAKSMRFYFNPVTQKIEPIGYDGGSLDESYFLPEISLNENVKFHDVEYFDSHDTYWYRLFFNWRKQYDYEFYSKYIFYLKKYTDSIFLTQFMSEIGEELHRNIVIINKDIGIYKVQDVETYFEMFSFSDKRYYGNQVNILDHFKNDNAIYSYFHGINGNTVEIKCANRIALPIQISALVLDNDTISFLHKQNIVFPSMRNSTLKYKSLHFPLESGFGWDDSLINNIKIQYSILGDDISKMNDVYPWNHMNQKDPMVYPNILESDLFVLDSAENHIYMKGDKLRINQTLYVPPGYKLVINSGQSIDLIDSASLISNSPIIALGTAEKPIRITSSDSTGEGVVILNSAAESRFQDVMFDNLSNVSQKGWLLTGAIVSYESPILFSGCIFRGNIRGDDYLNIIRAQYSIENCSFQNVYADAFDGDYCEGTIKNSEFINIGNDAIDVSGSNLTVLYTLIQNAGDKGLSAGENSSITANNVKIFDSEIGVASKDNSEINMENSFIENNRIGVTAFQKKSEYGSAIVMLSNVSEKSSEVDYLIETNSTVYIDSMVYHGNKENVSDLLYGKQYGKPSK
jgi:hypothetical protein